MFFQLMALLLGIGAVAAIAYLACLTAEAVVDEARAWWGRRTTVVVIDPAASAELERIARERGSRRYKRFVYNEARGETRLIESDSISGPITYQTQVELYVS